MKDPREELLEWYARYQARADDMDRLRKQVEGLPTKQYEGQVLGFRAIAAAFRNSALYESCPENQLLVDVGCVLSEIPL